VAQRDRGEGVIEAGKRLRITIPPVERLACGVVGCLDLLLGQRSARVPGDLAREALAVHPDHRADLRGRRRQTETGERLDPAVDAVLDGVHERAVEVEDQAVWTRQVGGHATPPGWPRTTQCARM